MTTPTTVPLVPIHRAALDSLVAALERACPPLKGHISAEADRDEKMAWPKLGIRLVRAPLVRANRGKLVNVSGGVVWDVGHFEAIIQLRLGAPTHLQRLELGERLMGAFMQDAAASGVLVTTLSEVHGATCSWVLDEEGWQDEMAVAQKWWSVVAVTGLIPCLVREQTFVTNDLRISFSEWPVIPRHDPQRGPTEVLRINADGTFTKLS